MWEGLDTSQDPMHLGGARWPVGGDMYLNTRLNVPVMTGRVDVAR